jgi:hypothetical protein
LIDFISIHPKTVTSTRDIDVVNIYMINRGSFNLMVAASAKTVVKKKIVTTAAHCT